MSLTEKEPAVVDLEALTVVRRIYTDMIDGLLPENKLRDVERCLSMLFERAIKASPADEDLTEEWFFSAFQQADWKNAQKVSESGSHPLPPRASTIQPACFTWG